MNGKAKKYYTLYKVQYKEDGTIYDIQYLYEVNNYRTIQKYLHIDINFIKSIINKASSKVDDLKTYRNYCIIVDKE